MPIQKDTFTVEFERTDDLTTFIVINDHKTTQESSKIFLKFYGSLGVFNIILFLGYFTIFKGV